MKVKIKVNNNVISRKVKLVPFGNFVMAIVRFKNEDYLLDGWDGDEYLRGQSQDIYSLGRNLTKKG